MSTRLITANTSLGLDSQFANLQADNRAIHDYLIEDSATVASNLTKLIIQNILYDQKFSTIFNSITDLIQADYSINLSITDIRNTQTILLNKVNLLSSRVSNVAAGATNNTINATYNNLATINIAIGEVITPRVAANINLPVGKVGAGITIIYATTYTVTVTPAASQKLNYQTTPTTLLSDHYNIYHYVYVGLEWGWIQCNDTSDGPFVFAQDYHVANHRDKILVDTSAGSKTVLLPGVANLYDYFTVIDVANTFGINPLIIETESTALLINNSVTLSPLLVDTANLTSLTFVYTATNHWTLSEDAPKPTAEFKTVTADLTLTASLDQYLIIAGTTATQLTLPSAPVALQTITIVDYRNFATYKLTIIPNGNSLNGALANLDLDIAYGTVSIVYVSATIGWVCKF